MIINMWLNVIKAKLISSQCIQQSFQQSAGWPQGLALPCAYESAIFAACICFAIKAVFFPATLLANLLPALPTHLGSQA